MNIIYRDLSRVNFASQFGYHMDLTETEAEALRDALRRALANPGEGITVSCPKGTDFRVSVWPESLATVCQPSQVRLRSPA